jgi:hypothetical protein
MRTKCMSLALGLAALATPIAQAQHAPAEHGSPPASVVMGVQAAGFNWNDAVIGGLVARVAIVLIAVLATLLTRRSRRAALPQRTDPSRA